MNILIGPDGRVWNVASGLLNHYLDCWSDPKALIRLATRTRGFVAISLVAARAHVKLPPNRLSRACFEQVMSLLSRSHAGRIVIDIDHPQLVPMIFSDIEDAAYCLSDLGHASALPPSSRFQAEVLDIERRNAPRREGMATHYQYWLRQRGRLEVTQMKRMHKRPLGFSELFARITPDHATVPETWPSYMRIYEPAVAERLIGKPFNEHEDCGYLQLSASSYVSTLRAGLPRFEMVDALMSPPLGPSRRIRFERLLLPWRTPQGEDFVSAIAYTRSRMIVPSSVT